ncbi:ABC transporter ATP-binding protein [Humisphaera borealis]|uniref:ABC transporter ATP-binding protein n=1 Tax=Humisphaera borealis TaxID=2807512 RepID=A0A7M2X218_9BACT|nr:ABC transporter ATP-binding protein [Humisphaera borealis]QOV91816.1 ABC transporter ATP-binding protein [Humisphaera borealis]
MANPAEQAAIHTEGLTKVYKDFWGRPKVTALSDLNLTIHRGEVFGLLGPNGSGKSTTIKLLLGLIFASQGKAWVLGKEAGSTDINEKIGFLPEESYLYKFLSGEETLRFYGKLFKIPKDVLDKRVPILLDTVGLDSKARKRKLREYSKGMARRIGLAQALINEPELILLDEPTTGLDPIGTREMKDLILSLKAQGKTVLLCSHLLADVQDVCDRITILFRGKMQEQGEVKSLLQVRDVTQIETKGLTDQQVEEVRKFMAQMGVADARVTHPTTTLEDLFIRIVNENTRGGLSSVSSDVQTGGKANGKAG